MLVWPQSFPQDCLISSDNFSESVNANSITLVESFTYLSLGQGSKVIE
jgi:hypothetical protein